MANAERAKRSSQMQSLPHDVDDAGETHPRGGKVGRETSLDLSKQAGTVEDLRYGDDLVACRRRA